jgi:hypothetical protein
MAKDYTRQADPFKWPWGDRRPLVVVMLTQVRPDFWNRPGPIPVCNIGQQYKVHCNNFGAVTAETSYGDLGLKPDEFEVIAWEPLTGQENR